MMLVADEKITPPGAAEMLTNTAAVRAARGGLARSASSRARSGLRQLLATLCRTMTAPPPTRQATPRKRLRRAAGACALAALYSIAIAALSSIALPAAAQQVIRMSTTTSTDNSGLLAYLLPAFEASTGSKVQVIAVGSGKALELAKNGDVDVTLVHARTAEDQFVAAGHGIDRRDVMFNDFVVVCPPSDPAHIAGGKDVVAAFKRIAASPVKFISRADNSGTDIMEKQYWQLAGITPPAGRYLAAGLGMGETLTMAGELQACTLADRATFSAYRDRTGLAISVEGDARMFNPYGIIAVNPARHPGINYRGARQLIDWIVSPAGQARIAAFRNHGQQLFFPSAKP
jgi:tungstate transport system substrate-binding protein